MPMDPTNLARAALHLPPASHALTNGHTSPSVVPASSYGSSQTSANDTMILELGDGTLLQGVSFGAAKSVAGECVFQTGMESQV